MKHLTQAEFDQLAAEAARYRWLRSKTSAHSFGNWYQFGFPGPLAIKPIKNPMRGSVAQHLDEAIDAEISGANTSSIDPATIVAAAGAIA
jgi:hypothetical protein